MAPGTSSPCRQITSSGLVIRHVASALRPWMRMRLCCLRWWLCPSRFTCRSTCWICSRGKVRTSARQRMSPAANPCHPPRSRTYYDREILVSKVKVYEQVIRSSGSWFHKKPFCWIKHLIVVLEFHSLWKKLFVSKFSFLCYSFDITCQEEHDIFLAMFDSFLWVSQPSLEASLLFLVPTSISLVLPKQNNIQR